MISERCSPWRCLNESIWLPGMAIWMDLAPRKTEIIAFGGELLEGFVPVLPRITAKSANAQWGKGVFPRVWLAKTLHESPCRFWRKARRFPKWESGDFRACWDGFRRRPRRENGPDSYVENQGSERTLTAMTDQRSCCVHHAERTNKKPAPYIERPTKSERDCGPNHGWLRHRVSARGEETLRSRPL